jgi:hypothetical protein
MPISLFPSLYRFVCSVSSSIFVDELFMYKSAELTVDQLVGNLNAVLGIFLYLFYHDFAKIYGPPQILHKDITPWPTAVGAARSGSIPLTPRATALRT